MESVPVIQTQIYNRDMLIPEDYQDGYRRDNYYPHVLPGQYGYGALKEQRLLSLLVRYYLRPSTMFIDVGAACGVYTVVAEYFHKCRCLAFESSIGVYHLLRQNVTKGLTTTVNAALTDATEKPHFIGKWGTGGIRVQHTPHPLMEEIPAKRLDDYPLSATNIIIKIDVEGMGDTVLRGGLEMVKRASVIVFEWHSDQERCGMTGILKDNGYDLQPITESHVIAVNPNANYTYELPKCYE